MIEYSKGRVVAMVDAIEDGRIVKVPEDYAVREGLLILRKYENISGSSLGQKDKKAEETRKNKGFIGMDDLRKPLSTKNNEILQELIDNFHWTLLQKRKGRGLTRKKVAEEIGESETNLKMIESGVLPMNNFILINKLEQYYGINLRKSKVADAPKKPLREIITFAKNEEQRKREGEGPGEEVIDVSENAGGSKYKKKFDSIKSEDDFVDLSRM